MNKIEVAVVILLLILVLVVKWGELVAIVYPMPISTPELRWLLEQGSTDFVYQSRD